jgi:hypothetical protein
VSLFSISIKCLVSEKEAPTVSLLSPSFAVWKSNTQWQGQPRSHCFCDGTESLLRAWLGRINAFQRVVFLVLMNLMIVSYLSHYDIITHSHFDTWRHNKISKARRSSKTFDLQPFFTKHISFTRQPQKSL